MVIVADTVSVGADRVCWRWPERVIVLSSDSVDVRVSVRVLSSVWVGDLLPENSSETVGDRVSVAEATSLAEIV